MTNRPDITLQPLDQREGQFPTAGGGEAPAHGGGRGWPIYRPGGVTDTL